MDKNFKEFVEKAMKAGKNIICVSDQFDVGYDDDTPKFISLERHEDIAEANEILGLGTNDYIYIESRHGDMCMPFEFDGYRWDIAGQMEFKIPENKKKESTEEFKAFWEYMHKMNNLSKFYSSAEIFKFLKNRKGSMIINLDSGALEVDSAKKEAWHEVLNDMAYKFNGMVYRSELYD